MPRRRLVTGAAFLLSLLLCIGVGGTLPIADDEPLIGLVGTRLLREGTIPAYATPDGGYGGSLTALLSTVGLMAFGPSIAGLRMTNILLSAAAVLVLLRGWRGQREAVPFWVTLVLMVAPPFVFLAPRVRLYGYTASFLLCCLLIVLVQRFYEERKKYSPFRLLGFGGVSGLAFWLNPQTVIVIGPVWLLLLLRAPSCAKRWTDLPGWAGLLLVGTALGLTPMWARLLYGLPMINTAGTASPFPDWAQAPAILQQAPKRIFMMFGAFSATTPWVRYASAAFSAGCIGLGFLGLVAEWRARPERRWMSVLLLSLIGGAGLYVLSGRMYDSLRYMTFAYPALVLLMATGYRHVHEKHFRIGWLLLLWCVISVLSLAVQTHTVSRQPQGMQPDQIAWMMRAVRESESEVVLAPYGWDNAVLYYSSESITGLMYNGSSRALPTPVHPTGKTAVLLVDEPHSTFRQREELLLLMRASGVAFEELRYGRISLCTGFESLGQAQEALDAAYPPLRPEGG